MKKESFFFKLSKKNFLFKKLYFLYNIYVRNYKHLNKSSQFGEDDYILDLFEKEYKGFYLDIGCYHPTKHNNTYKMYKQGWRGINVDLNQFTIDLFNFLRSKDININSAISGSEEKKEMYFIDELNTQNTLEKNHLEFLKKHHSVKDNEINIIPIKTIKLDKILEQYNFKNIDFMNIDIEGHEINVLKSLDFNKYLIKTICIEMIDHNSLSKEQNEKIKILLNQKGYLFLKKIGFNYFFKKC